MIVSCCMALDSIHQTEWGKYYCTWWLLCEASRGICSVQSQQCRSRSGQSASVTDSERQNDVLSLLYNHMVPTYICFTGQNWGILFFIGVIRSNICPADYWIKLSSPIGKTFLHSVCFPANGDFILLALYKHHISMKFLPANVQSMRGELLYIRL